MAHALDAKSRAAASSSASSSATPTAAAGRAFELRAVDESSSAAFVCVICQNLSHIPVITPCEHIFCQTCLNDWLKSNRTCPNDRKPLAAASVKLLRDANSFTFNKVLSSVQIRCPLHYTAGCKWTGDYANANDHINKTCAYELVDCTYAAEGCTVRVRRWQLSAHVLDSSHMPLLAAALKRATSKPAANDSAPSESRRSLSVSTSAANALDSKWPVGAFVSYSGNESKYGRITSVRYNAKAPHPATHIRLSMDNFDDTEADVWLDVKSVTVLSPPLRESIPWLTYGAQFNLFDFSVGARVDVRGLGGRWYTVQVVGLGVDPQLESAHFVNVRFDTHKDIQTIYYYRSPDRFARLNTRTGPPPAAHSHPFSIGDTVDVWYYADYHARWRFRKWRIAVVNEVSKAEVGIKFVRYANTDLPAEVLDRVVYFGPFDRDIHPHVPTIDTDKARHANRIDHKHEPVPIAAATNSNVAAAAAAAVAAPTVAAPTAAVASSVASTLPASTVVGPYCFVCPSNRATPRLLHYTKTAPKPNAFSVPANNRCSACPSRPISENKRGYFHCVQCQSCSLCFKCGQRIALQRRLWIGNIPPDFVHEDLLDLVNDCFQDDLDRAIAAFVATNSDGTSKGWGMVTFASQFEADFAAELLRRSVWDWGQVNVKPDQRRG